MGKPMPNTISISCAQILNDKVVFQLKKNSCCRKRHYVKNYAPGGGILTTSYSESFRFAKQRGRIRSRLFFKCV